MSQKIFVFDGSKFDDLKGFYHEVSNLMMPDADWEVGSLDGFYDVLFGGYGAYEPGDEVEIIWKNSEKSKYDLGKEATQEFYEKKLKIGHPYNTEKIEADLAELLSGKGKTLFDILADCIHEHENIQFKLE